MATLQTSIDDKTKAIELNDSYGSYVCEYGYLHDYGKIQSKIAEATKEIIGPFHSIEDMMKELDDE